VEVGITFIREVYGYRMKLFSEYINEKSGALAVGDIIWINLSEEDVIV